MTSELPWKKWKQSKHLNVSSRISTIDQLTEIKVTALVNSSLSGFLLFIQDVKNTPAWLTNASSSKVVKNFSATEHIFTVNFSAIWPLKPRHLQLHSHYWQNSDLSVEIQLKDDFSVEIEHKNTVRVKFYEGHWLLTPILNNKQQKQLIIEYTFIADGGGEMPKWFADQLALKSILKSMKKMNQQLPQSKWQQQTIPGITELSL
ncbi:hypothetical protein [Candidatus Colwellia aromaticivorans]|uniref:hypothetical protein n=1 Tax=Candidatus Colwellia aromaticivorans TaxID=2267621 RepID=UPI00109BB5AB|nr:hypothetical protein [Candidatus Colwellia aromaticivorans]